MYYVQKERKLMKKLLSVVLALCMMLGTVAPMAFATETDVPVQDSTEAATLKSGAPQLVASIRLGFYTRSKLDNKLQLPMETETLWAKTLISEETEMDISDLVAVVSSDDETPEGMEFAGWRRWMEGEDETGAEVVMIPANVTVLSYSVLRDLGASKHDSISLVPVYKAKAEPVKTITLEFLDAKANVFESVVLNDNEPELLKAIPENSKEGYDFLGWKQEGKDNLIPATVKELNYGAASEYFGITEGTVRLVSLFKVHVPEVVLPAGKVEAKVYVNYDNAIPEDVTAELGNEHFGPAGDGTPYFTVTVDLDKLNAKDSYKYEVKNGKKFYYANGSDSAFWTDVLDCMSLVDRAKFERFGLNKDYLGYVLKQQDNENDWHIDGILNNTRGFLTEFYTEEGALKTPVYKDFTFTSEPLTMAEAQAKLAEIAGVTAPITWEANGKKGTYVENGFNYTIEVRRLNPLNPVYHEGNVAYLPTATGLYSASRLVVKTVKGTVVPDITKPTGTAEAKVYLYYPNIVPKDVTKPIDNKFFGPAGDGTPYFTVTVDLDKLNEKSHVFYDPANFYYAEEGSKNREFWNDVLSCMSAEDAKKFNKFGNMQNGDTNYMGYVLKLSDNGWHIDGILDYKQGYYTEYYVIENGSTTLPVLKNFTLGDSATTKAIARDNFANIAGVAASDITWDEADLTHVKGSYVKDGHYWTVEVRRLNVDNNVYDGDYVDYVDVIPGVFHLSRLVVETAEGEAVPVTESDLVIMNVAPNTNNKKFSFTLTLPAGEYEADYTYFNENDVQETVAQNFVVEAESGNRYGHYTFTLTHEAYLTIKGMDIRAEYRVTEASYENYRTKIAFNGKLFTADGRDYTGQILEGENKLIFTNIYEEPEEPERPRPNPRPQPDRDDDDDKPIVKPYPVIKPTQNPSTGANI